MTNIHAKYTTLYESDDAPPQPGRPLPAPCAPAAGLFGAYASAADPLNNKARQRSAEVNEQRNFEQFVSI